MSANHARYNGPTHGLIVVARPTAEPAHKAVRAIMPFFIRGCMWISSSPQSHHGQGPNNSH
jgi:hypothetical protein